MSKAGTFLVASDNKKGQKIAYEPFFKYECPKGRLIFEVSLSKKPKKFVFRAKDRDEIVKNPVPSLTTPAVAQGV